MAKKTRKAKPAVEIRFRATAEEIAAAVDRLDQRKDVIEATM